MAEMRAYSPTLRQRMIDATAAALEKAGYSRSSARASAERASQVIGGIFDVQEGGMAAQEGAQELSQGNIGRGLLDVSLGTLQVASGAVPFLARPVAAASRAVRASTMPDIAAERAEAFRIAQQNAAKPASEGGLGLPPMNTPEQRAAAMGFMPDSPLYHGSLYDIQKVNLGRGDPGAFVGQGFYTTPSPEDASINYASIYGPDTKAKIERGIEESEKDLRRIYSSLQDETLSPARAEVLLRETGTGENLGAVYPLLVRRGQEANMVERGKSAYISPGEVFDEAAEEYLPTENSGAWQDAFNVFREYGVDPPDELYELSTQGGTLDEIWDAVANSRGLQAYDPDTGMQVTSGGLATEVVKALGANTVTHPTEFRNQALNIAGQHTIALQPTGIVRSRFAAFDPARITSPDLLAGVAGPTVLAAALMEQERREKERKKGEL